MPFFGKTELFKTQTLNHSEQTTRGLILVFTGNGKGKTSAAMGVLMRANGWGLRVGVLQFIKSPGRVYG
jgi:cob(I)alamin adenosyltransferase